MLGNQFFSLKIMMNLDIKSKVSKQGNRAGQTLYYAYPSKREKLSLEQVLERTESTCSLSRVDIETALRAFAEVVCTSLEEGIGVDLGEMGTLMPFAQGKLMNTPEEVTQETLQPAKVIIHPKKNIRTALSRIKYHINKAQE